MPLSCLVSQEQFSLILFKNNYKLLEQNQEKENLELVFISHQQEEKKKDNLNPIQLLFDFVYFNINKEYLFAGRPGRRLWCCDKKSGKVLSTLSFPKIDSAKLNFSTLLPFGPYILTWSDELIAVLDVQKLLILDFNANLKPIISVSIFRNRCYVLHGEEITLSELFWNEELFRKEQMKNEPSNEKLDVNMLNGEIVVQENVQMKIEPILVEQEILKFEIEPDSKNEMSETTTEEVKELPNEESKSIQNESSLNPKVETPIFQQDIKPIVNSTPIIEPKIEKPVQPISQNVSQRIQPSNPNIQPTPQNIAPQTKPINQPEIMQKSPQNVAQTKPITTVQPIMNQPITQSKPNIQPTPQNVSPQQTKPIVHQIVDPQVQIKSNVPIEVKPKPEEPKIEKEVFRVKDSEAPQLESKNDGVIEVKQKKKKKKAIVREITIMESKSNPNPDTPLKFETALNLSQAIEELAQQEEKIEEDKTEEDADKKKKKKKKIIKKKSVDIVNDEPQKAPELTSNKSLTNLSISPSSSQSTSPSMTPITPSSIDIPKAQTISTLPKEIKVESKLEPKIEKISEPIQTLPKEIKETEEEKFQKLISEEKFDEFRKLLNGLPLLNEQVLEYEKTKDLIFCPDLIKNMKEFIKNLTNLIEMEKVTKMLNKENQKLIENVTNFWFKWILKENLMDEKEIYVLMETLKMYLNFEKLFVLFNLFEMNEGIEYIFSIQKRHFETKIVIDSIIYHLVDNNFEQAMNIISESILENPSLPLRFFKEIVDFDIQTSIKYAVYHYPNIHYWNVKKYYQEDSSQLNTYMNSLYDHRVEVLQDYKFITKYIQVLLNENEIKKDLILYLISILKEQEKFQNELKEILSKYDFYEGIVKVYTMEETIDYLIKKDNLELLSHFMSDKSKIDLWKFLFKNVQENENISKQSVIILMCNLLNSNEILKILEDSESDCENLDPIIYTKLCELAQIEKNQSLI
jgi:hypothetical protein